MNTTSGWVSTFPLRLIAVRDLTIIIPCHKEKENVVYKLYYELKDMGAQVIVVDDGGDMDLLEDINHITYQPNMGYGYAIKQGLRIVETPLACTMDGDGQHTAKDVYNLYQVYKLRTDLKMVVGQRWLNYEKPIRWIGRKVLNFIASIITGHYLSDLNSGLRIFDAKLVQNYSPILCDTFSFTTSLSISMVSDGYKIAYFPIDVKPRAFGKSHVRLVTDGLITLFYILYCGVGCRTRKLRYALRGA